MADTSNYSDSNGYDDDNTGEGSASESITGTPRWVKVFAIIALVVILLFVILLLTRGSHGPGRHSGGNNSHTTVLRRHTTWRATVMTMTPGVRKFALTAHVTSSVGWLGAIVGFLALAIAGLTSQDAQTVRAAHLAMDLTGWYVIVPLSFASLLTGLVSALGTKWGLFRHYWVLFKLLINVFANIVLLMYMPTLDYFAGVAADTTLSAGDLRMLRDPSAVLHASLALLLLLVATVLGLYKPRGMTAYGCRKQREQRTVTQS